MHKRRVFERALHIGGVRAAVGLHALGAHRRALARVQRPRLERADIGGTAHLSAQRVDFINKAGLSRPAYGWIARHVCYRVERKREQQALDSGAGACERGFDSGVAGADDRHGLNIVYNHRCFLCGIEFAAFCCGMGAAATARRSRVSFCCVLPLALFEEDTADPSLAVIAVLPPDEFLLCIMLPLHLRYTLYSDHPPSYAAIAPDELLLTYSCVSGITTLPVVSIMPTLFFQPSTARPQ